MSEREKAEKTQSEIIGLVEQAQAEIRQAKERLFAGVERSQALCEQAKNIAQEWNRQAESLVLQEDFLVTGWVDLPRILAAVERTDIYTPAGLLTRKPVTPDDLAPQWMKPGQRRVA